MIKELNVNDFTVVESIIAKLHKLHVENRPRSEEHTSELQSRI